MSERTYGPESSATNQLFPVSDHAAEEASQQIGSIEGPKIFNVLKRVGEWDKVLPHAHNYQMELRDAVGPLRKDFYTKGYLLYWGAVIQQASSVNLAEPKLDWADVDLQIMSMMVDPSDQTFFEQVNGLSGQMRAGSRDERIDWSTDLLRFEIVMRILSPNIDEEFVGFVLDDDWERNYGIQSKLRRVIKGNMQERVAAFWDSEQTFLRAMVPMMSVYSDDANTSIQAGFADAQGVIQAHYLNAQS